MSEEITQPNKEKDLEFDDQEFESVEISDSDIEKDDQRSQKARRQAKKEARKNATPEEAKRARRKKDFIALGILLALIAIILAIPYTRWPMLNAVGFRGNLAVTIKEKESHKPISAATVVLSDGHSITTDDFGRATFAQIKLGKHVLTASKAGYGTVESKAVNGLGTTQASTIDLKVIGIKLDVVIKDWLSGQLIEGATVSLDKSTAQSDKTGLASIVIPPTDERKVTLAISAKNYFTKSLETEVAISSREVSLVAAPKNYFISKRDGKFDIFSSNLDGSGQQKIIEATGKEGEALLQFSINRNNQQAVLVANREGKIQNNRIVAGVYIVDLEKSTLRKIDEGSDVQILDWVDETIVYTKTSPELNYNDPNFAKLQSYNITKSRLSQIAQTNYFQIGLVAQSKVFYLPADSYRTIENAVLTSFDIGSSASKTYLADKRLQYATRASFGTLEIQDNDGKNYELQVGTGGIKNIDRQPVEQLNFAQKPGGSHVAWSDRRDGQGALLVRSVSANDEKIVVRVGGLTYPVRFVGEDLIVVRVATSQETADYVVHIASGKMAKVVDVSNVGSWRSNGL